MLAAALTAFWVIAMIVNGVSIIGTQRYADEDACQLALGRNATGVVKAVCVPIYQGKSDEPPAFRCQDGYGDLKCDGWESVGGT